MHELQDQIRNVQQELPRLKVGDAVCCRNPACRAWGDISAEVIDRTESLIVVRCNICGQPRFVIEPSYEKPPHVRVTEDEEKEEHRLIKEMTEAYQKGENWYDG